MQAGNLYKWALDSYKQTSESLSNVREQLERRLVGMVAAGRLEVAEALKTVTRAQNQIAELRGQLEDRVVRKYEAVLDLLGIPSEREIDELKRRVERLSKKVKGLSNNDKSGKRAPKG